MPAILRCTQFIYVKKNNLKTLSIVWPQELLAGPQLWITKHICMLLWSFFLILAMFFWTTKREVCYNWCTSDVGLDYFWSYLKCIKTEASRAKCQFFCVCDRIACLSCTRRDLCSSSLHSSIGKNFLFILCIYIHTKFMDLCSNLNKLFIEIQFYYEFTIITDTFRALH